jgi:magnesium and cobalt transporter
VRDVMVPRTQMVVIQHDDSPEEFFPHIIESAHSRFPVIGDNRDEVLGILLAKDLLPYFIKKDQGELDIRELLRPAVFIPESKRLNVLLRDFRANRNHMAIVVDEYGGIAGLVTIEDVLEQIVGEIEDEHDIDDDTYIIKHSDMRYTAKALTPIEEFNEQFGVEIPVDGFDTIGGLLTREFGHLPKRGESVTIDKFKFKILRADSRRIFLVQINITNEASTEESQTGTA